MDCCYAKRNITMKKKAVFFIIFLVFASFGFSYAQSISMNQFGAVWQDSIQWKSFPGFPKNVKQAILVGNPVNTEPFLVRVKVPSNENHHAAYTS
jgi:hypothetical protein